MPTSATLLERVRQLDPGGWEELYRRYKGMVVGFIVRSGISPADAEDIAQDVFTSVARNPPGPSPRPGSFRVWLFELTRWRIADFLDKPGHFRTVPLRTGDETGTAPAERVPDADVMAKAWEEDWERGLIDLALERVARRSSPLHFQIFELSEKRGWSAAKIARELEVNIATIYVIRHRLGKQFRREIADLQSRWG